MYTIARSASDKPIKGGQTWPQIKMTMKLEPAIARSNSTFPHSTRSSSRKLLRSFPKGKRVKVLQESLEMVSQLVTELEADTWWKLVYRLGLAVSFYKMVRKTSKEGGSIIIRDANGKEQHLYVPD